MASTCEAVGPPAFCDQVSRARCLRLVTFHPDGTPAPATVWFVEHAGRLLVWTPAGSGKVDRIARTSRVRVSTCTSRGVPTSREVGAVASVGPREAASYRLLARKYGWRRWLLECHLRLRRALRRRTEQPLVCLSVTVDGNDDRGPR